MSAARRWAFCCRRKAVSLWIVSDSRRFEDKVGPKSNQTAPWAEYSAPLRVIHSRPVHDYAIRAKPFRFLNKIPGSFALVRSRAQERERRNLFVLLRRYLLEVVNSHRLFRCTPGFIRRNSLRRGTAR